MRRVWAYSRTTGRKRAVPVSWLRVFPDEWARTPSSASRAEPDPVDKDPDVADVEDPEPVTTVAGSSSAPDDGDTPGKDQ